MIGRRRRSVPSSSSQLLGGSCNARSLGRPDSCIDLRLANSNHHYRRRQTIANEIADNTHGPHSERTAAQQICAHMDSHFGPITFRQRITLREKYAQCSEYAVFTCRRKQIEPKKHERVDKRRKRATLSAGKSHQTSMCAQITCTQKCTVLFGPHDRPVQRRTLCTMF